MLLVSLTDSLPGIVATGRWIVAAWLLVTLGSNVA